jgi:AcrR family transcriptional regulator
MLVAGPRRSDRRRPGTYDEILDAAEAVLAANESARLTLHAVAKRAGLSQGGLLYSFSSKEALLSGLIWRLIERHERRVQEELEAAGEDGGRRGGALAELRARVRAAGRDAPAHARAAQAILAVASADPRLLEPVRKHVARCLAGLRGEAGDRFPQAAAASAALCGLALLELLGLLPLRPEERARVLAVLAGLAADGGVA